MKKLLLILSFILLSPTKAQAATENFASLEKTAKDFLVRLQLPEGNESSFKLQKCMQPKETNPFYSYFCLFHQEGETLNRSYAVLLDRNLRLSGIVRGRAVGKGNSFDYNLKISREWKPLQTRPAKESETKKEK